jgi:hypothetical protein
MRSYLESKKYYRIADLRRIYADAKRNARKALTDETFNRNLEEAKAVGYVLYVAQRGKAPYRGRPSARAAYLLSRTIEKN